MWMTGGRGEGVTHEEGLDSLKELPSKAHEGRFVLTLRLAPSTHPAAERTEQGTVAGDGDKTRGTEMQR